MPNTRATKATGGGSTAWSCYFSNHDFFRKPRGASGPVWTSGNTTAPDRATPHPVRGTLIALWVASNNGKVLAALHWTTQREMQRGRNECERVAKDCGGGCGSGGRVFWRHAGPRRCSGGVYRAAGVCGSGETQRSVAGHHAIQGTGESGRVLRLGRGAW